MVKKFFPALLGGLGLVTSAMTAAPAFQHRSGGASDLDRIRADVQRVGEDMAKVIEREHAKART